MILTSLSVPHDMNFDPGFAKSAGKAISRWDWCVVRAIPAFGMLLACSVSVHAQESRRITEVTLSLDAARWVVEDAEGLTLAAPNLFSIVRDAVIVTDPVAPAVIAYDLTSGRLLWRYSRKGRGPGEMWEPSLAAWHPQGVVVSDNATRRLTVLDMKGQFISSQQVPRAQFVLAVCARSTGDLLVNVAGPEDQSLLVLPGDGTKERPYGVLFPPASSSPLALGGAVDLVSLGESGQRCIASRKMEDGLAILDLAGVSRRARFIEPMRQRPAKSYTAIKDTSDLPLSFSQHAGFDGRNVFVWFGGQSCARRCIDLYDPATLAYRRSWRLVGRTGIGIQDVALSGLSLVILGTRDGTPILAAFPLPNR